MRKIFILVAVLASLSIAAYASTIRATLSWNDSTGEDGYRIERAVNPGTGPGTFAPIGVVAANVTSFVDSSLTLGTSYCWRVIAFNALGDAAPSPNICASAPSLPTPAGGLQVVITVVP